MFTHHVNAVSSFVTAEQTAYMSTGSVECKYLTQRRLHALQSAHLTVT